MQHKYHRQGCVTMKQNVEDRAAMLGAYIVEVSSVLAVNKAQRHIRGGMATKRKYEAQKK